MLQIVLNLYADVLKIQLWYCWEPVLERVSNLAFKTLRQLVLRALKIRLQNDGSVNVFKSSYTSWRPVFETGLQDSYEDVLQIIFQPLYQRFEDPTVVVLRTTWIIVLKGALNEGCKTSITVVLRTLKKGLQDDRSVNVFKSSYPSWRPVLKTGLQDVFNVHFCPMGVLRSSN